MHQVAAELTRLELLPQDSVAIAAWEGSVWDWKEPATVQGADGAARATWVTSLLPKTAQQQTQGGHDTEQAIVDIVNHLQQAGPEELAHSIIVMIAGDERSEAGEGQKRTLGTNAPTYLGALKQVSRFPALPLTYTVRDKALSTSKQYRLDVVLLLPKSFHSDRLSAPRTQLLTSASPSINSDTHGSGTVTQQKEQERHGPNWPLIIVIILAIGIGVALLATKAMQRPGRGKRQGCAAQAEHRRNGCHADNARRQSSRGRFGLPRGAGVATCWSKLSLAYSLGLCGGQRNGWSSCPAPSAYFASREFVGTRNRRRCYCHYP